MTTVKERLEEYRKLKHLSQAQFQEKADLSNGFINNMKGGISTSSLKKIKTAFPDLDTNWLQTGEGEMITDELQVMDLGAEIAKISAKTDVILSAVAEILATVKGQTVTKTRADLETMVNNKLGTSLE